MGITHSKRRFICWLSEGRHKECTVVNKENVRGRVLRDRQERGEKMEVRWKDRTDKGRGRYLSEAPGVFDCAVML